MGPTTSLTYTTCISKRCFMIETLGEDNIRSLKRAFVRRKEAVSTRIKTIINEYEMELSKASNLTERKYTSFQISYYLRNPKETPMWKLLEVLTLIRSGLSKQFKDRKVKYILHPTWIRDKFDEPIFINGSQVANLHGVSLDECILKRFASDKQWVECEHLKMKK